MLDYYGRRLATCSSDKTIKIFDIEGENHKLTESTFRTRQLDEAHNADTRAPSGASLGYALLLPSDLC